MQREPDRAMLGRDLPIRRLITGLWQMADQERDGKPFAGQFSASIGADCPAQPVERSRFGSDKCL